MRPNSWDIDAALVALLQADAQLKALAPDGVYFSLAPPDSKRFVLVTLADSVDGETFNGRAFEDTGYAVVFVGLTTVTTDTDASAAAYRIDQLLADASLTATGYATAAIARDPNRPRIRTKEPTGADLSIAWHNGGGVYRVHAPIADVTAAAKSGKG